MWFHHVGSLAVIKNDVAVSLLPSFVSQKTHSETSSLFIHTKGVAGSIQSSNKAGIFLVLITNHESRN
jgi:hypothetical protein